MNFKKITVAVMARALVAGVAVSAVSMAAPAIAQAPSPTQALSASIVAAVNAAIANGTSVQQAIEAAIIASGQSAAVVSAALASAKATLGPALAGSSLVAFNSVQTTVAAAITAGNTGSVSAGGGTTGGIAFAPASGGGGGGGGTGTHTNAGQ